MIKVIGAGLGRTGTMSLKSAFETLGFGPCYHMFEVTNRPEHADAWHRIAFSGKMDWSVFDGYQSITDWPAVHYWRELAAHYPDAKVVLPVRNAESWYKSVYDTIFTRLTTPLPAQAPESRHRHRAMARKIVLDEFFGGRFEDKAHAIAAYNRRNEEVRRTIEPSRLLVYDMKDGWEPLCRFLDVPIPGEPFPRLNDTASFLAWVAEDDEELRK